MGARLFRMENINTHATPRSRPIFVIENDAWRLRNLLSARRESSVRDETHLSELEFELERAVLLSPEAIPANVIVMDSIVRLVDLTSGESRDYTLVYPADSNPSLGRISVLAPLGTAMLGNREGDEVAWRMPGGMRRLRIEKVRSPHEYPVRH